MNQPTPTPPERGAGIRPCLISSPPGGVRGGFTVPMRRRKAEGVLHEPVAATVKTVKRRQILRSVTGRRVTAAATGSWSPMNAQQRNQLSPVNRPGHPIVDCLGKAALKALALQYLRGARGDQTENQAVVQLVLGKCWCRRVFESEQVRSAWQIPNTKAVKTRPSCSASLDRIRGIQ